VPSTFGLSEYSAESSGDIPYSGHEAQGLVSADRSGCAKHAARRAHEPAQSVAEPVPRADEGAAAEGNGGVAERDEEASSCTDLDRC
jgi:hypothetical protein